MASTGSVVYVKHRLASTTHQTQSSGSKVYTTFRALSGPYSTTEVVQSVNSRNKKVAPPRIGDVIGWATVGAQRVAVTFEPAFHRWLVQELYERRLGGDAGATLPDVATTVETAQVTASAVASTVAGVSQVVTQNAEALAATVQSVQVEGLAGSSQIPQVQRTSQLLL